MSPVPPPSPWGGSGTWGLGRGPVGQEDPQVRGSPSVPPERGREAPAPLARQLPPRKHPEAPQQRGQARRQLLQRLGRDPPDHPLLSLGGWGRAIPARAGGQQAPNVERFDLAVEEAAVAQPVLGDHRGLGGAQGAPQSKSAPRGRPRPARGSSRTPPGPARGDLRAEFGRVAFPFGPEAFGFRAGGDGEVVSLRGGPRDLPVVAHGGGGGWERAGKREVFEDFSPSGAPQDPCSPRGMSWYSQDPVIRPPRTS